jgi:type I restriction-modification system DNA methylase subunit
LISSGFLLFSLAMSEQTFSQAFARVNELVENFQAGEQTYLEAKYSEAQARLDFIDKFWMALGWDVSHERERNPYRQEVKVERGVAVSNRLKKADYAFFAAPNFRDVKFYVEAKKPAKNLDNADDYFQTIRYGWSSNTPLAVLTDFEQFRVIDCRYKPNISTAINFALKKIDYREYADEAKFREIYHLFSRDSVIGGSLEEYARALPKRGRGAKQGRLFATGVQKSVDESFLDDLDGYREQLARSFKNKNAELGGDDLTEAVTRTIDRLVFIRFLEDKLIEPETMMDKFDSWSDFVRTSKNLEGRYNGVVFKTHFIDKPEFKPDEKVFTDICGELSDKNSPYSFNYIPVHILGSIYERFLGKVIVATEKRATVEEKPEVRKAGGVYYTPEYIVRYIVENTVGKLTEGKMPDEIKELRFADIACGSGSFLLGVFDYLLRYHTTYYNQPGKKGEARAAESLENPDGSFTLTIEQRRAILRNNIFGVDLDAQAVEVAQLSLALKLLEDASVGTVRVFQPRLGEKILPDMTRNIVCGNSLVDHDILDGKLFETNEQKKLNPMSYEDKFPAVMRRGGFDAIVGNPPYIRIQTMQENVPIALDYFKRNYDSAAKGNYDIYVVFVEQALRKMNERAALGYILPHKFFNAKYGEPLRGLMAKGKNLSHIVHFGDQQIFDGATTYTALLFANKSATEEIDFVKAADLSAWREDKTSLRGTIQAANVTANEWNFTVGEGSALFEKLNSMPYKLGDVADIFVGLQTSADDVFILDFVSETPTSLHLRSKALGSEFDFEKDLLFPIISGIDVKRYSNLPERQYILFPYQTDNENATLLSLHHITNNFPLTASYLRQNKNRLESREKGKFKGDGWHKFGRSQNLGIQNRSKICVPRLVSPLHATFDAEGNHFLDNVDVGGVTLKAEFESQDLRYLLALINSKLLRWYFPSVSAPFRGGFLSANRQFLSQLPIRAINFANESDKAAHDKMVALVEQMLAAKAALAAARTDRDKSFYHDRCAALDRQIDSLVFDLYALSDAEKQIVKGETRA